ATKPGGIDACIISGLASQTSSTWLIRCRRLSVSGDFVFFFYADDRTEPRHVHVQREARTAKFWLDPIECEWSSGFSRSELMDIYRFDCPTSRITLAEMA